MGELNYQVVKSLLLGNKETQLSGKSPFVEEKVLQERYYDLENRGDTLGGWTF